MSTERHNYASVSIPEDDEEAYKRNVEHLKQEFLKGSLRLEVVKSFIRRTFPHRRKGILAEQTRVDTLVEDFPHLKKTSLVSCLIQCMHTIIHNFVLFDFQLALEFDLVMKTSDSLNHFSPSVGTLGMCNPELQQGKQK